MKDAPVRVFRGVVQETSSYEIAARSLNYETFNLLSVHFEFVRSFIEITINSNKIY